MISDLSLIPRLQPGVRLSQDPISAEPILLYPEGFVILNPTAYAVVSLCDGKTPVSELIKKLAEEYEAEEEVLREEVLACLQELEQILVLLLPRAHPSPGHS